MPSLWMANGPLPWDRYGGIAHSHLLHREPTLTAAPIIKMEKFNFLTSAARAIKVSPASGAVASLREAQH
jgi:hypothetical protein